MLHLPDLLAKHRPLVAPGVYDALTARLAVEAGFEALYLSGAGIAYTRLGRPDIGLVSMSEVAEVIALIRDRVDVPLIVDGDTGFGNALNVQRTIRVFERAGASAVQLEDQTFPKRCGHLSGKALVSAGEMAGKIRAAVNARASQATLIVARTDAIAVEGFEPALERAETYLAAGADVLFIEAPRSEEELAAIGRTFGDRVPLLANMVEGGRTPVSSADELARHGFRLVIFPGGIVRAQLRQARDYYSSLRRAGSNTPFLPRMADFDELNEAVELRSMLEAGDGYASDGDTRAR